MSLPTGMTDEPVVSRAMAAIWSPDAGILEGLARGNGERGHLVVVRLRGVLGIFALAMQRVLGNGGTEHAPLAIDDRYPHAQRAEVDARHNRHQQPPCAWCQYMSQPK